MPAPMPSPPPVTTATRPSRSRFQSSIGGTPSAGSSVVTRHSDGPYAAVGENRFQHDRQRKPLRHLPTTPHRAARLFAAFLLGLFYLVAVTRVVDVEDVRRTVAATGPLRR